MSNDKPTLEEVLATTRANLNYQATMRAHQAAQNPAYKTAEAHHLNNLELSRRIAQLKADMEKNDGTGR